MGLIKLSKNMDRNYTIDVLKFLFILGIVLFHVHGYFNDPFNSILGKVYIWGGSLGNNFFFISSGFLIATRYKEKISIEKDYSLYLFIKMRLLHIYPMYFMSNVIQFSINAVANKNIDLNRLFLTLILMGGGCISRIEPPNFPTWFICVLVLCYLLFYFVCKLTGGSKEKYTIAIILLIIWGYICRSGKIDFPFCYNITGSPIMIFFNGCLLSEVVYSEDNEFKKLFNIGLYIFFVITILLSCFYGISSVTSDTGAMISFVIIPAVIICSINYDVFNNKLLCRVSKLLGDLSMSIFFWHIPIFSFYKWTNDNLLLINNGKLSIVVFIALLLGMSFLFMLLFNNLKKNCFRIHNKK